MIVVLFLLVALMVAVVAAIVLAALLFALVVAVVTVAAVGIAKLAGRELSDRAIGGIALTAGLATAAVLAFWTGHVAAAVGLGALIGALAAWSCAQFERQP